MTAPVFSAGDFLTAMQSLLPRGRAWPRDLGSTLAKVLAGLAPTYARIAARDNQLLVEALPSTTDELLPEWEATLGLPDPRVDSSTDELKAQVLARFTNSGGQSVPFFVAYAAALGYEITIDLFKPFRFGDTFGLPLYGERWIYVWIVNAPATAEASKILEYEFDRLKPAHTTVNFVYA